MALPAIVCLKSVYNNKYLRYRNGEVQTNGVLQFSGETAMDSLAQFEVVPAKLIGGYLVHLKSCYTNKYLVRWSPNHYWITASAEKPNEDVNSWGCTLFKPTFLDDEPTKARLMHVQLGHYACLWRIGEPFDSCLFAGSKDPDHDSCDIVTVVDWESTLKLPKNVAFKGECGKYLGAFVDDDGTQYLQFSYDQQTDPEVAQQVFTNSDGTISIKSKYYGKFWRLGKDDWIVADVTEPSSADASAMFRVNVVDINFVALLNMSKTWYCKRYTLREKESLLNAATQSVDEYALLEVEDLDH